MPAHDGELAIWPRGVRSTVCVRQTVEPVFGNIKG